ncbi:MAG TPA: RNA 2',3'-cyclic phosphodiesterase [Sphingomicrobium sp.]|nr:RNA 2',3'-cyclic phosphodiesterase [Sphingomicrobium sp.]
MHRLFVAIRPPETIRKQLLGLMGGVHDLRWQNDNQLHLTLRFIGEVERPRADDIAAELGRIRFEHFPVALDGVGKFEKRRSGAIWAGLQPKDELKTLAAKVERACQSAGLEPEPRAYRPHITLARWNGRAPNLDRFLERHCGLASDPWEVREFILFESRLGQGGAHYEPVESFLLQHRSS